MHKKYLSQRSFKYATIQQTRYIKTRYHPTTTRMILPAIALKQLLYRTITLSRLQPRFRKHFAICVVIYAGIHSVAYNLRIVVKQNHSLGLQFVLYKPLIVLLFCLFVRIYAHFCKVGILSQVHASHLWIHYRRWTPAIQQHKVCFRIANMNRHLVSIMSEHHVYI